MKFYVIDLLGFVKIHALNSFENHKLNSLNPNKINWPEIAIIRDLEIASIFCHHSVS